MSVLATGDLEYVVVDYDLQANGDSPVGEKLKPDYISEDLAIAFSSNEPSDIEIREELKRLKF